jgi:O-antigen ligase
MLKAMFEKIKQNPFLAMALCCGLPLVAIYAFSALGLQGLLGKWGIYALVLLCPLAHIWMMRGMFRDPEYTRKPHRIKEIEHK